MQPGVDQDFTSLFISVTAAMVFICLLAFVILKWVLPRFIRTPLSRKGNWISVLGRYSLEARQALYVLRIGRKHVVVSCSDKGVSLVTSLEETDLPDEWKQEE